MADLTTPILSVCTTVESKFAGLGIHDGRLTFVRDAHKIALDFDGKRTIYSQIQELATEGARTSMLAPITGAYYFVLETGILWTYQDGWVQITVTPEQFEPDTTLTLSGKAADSKVVGEALSTKLNSNDLPYAIDNALAQAKASGEFDGPQGEQGPKGDPGISGVYVGAGDMPENCNVQIDPSGDVTLVPVRGIDYWTDEDKAEIVSSVLAALPVYDGGVIAV